MRHKKYYIILAFLLQSILAISQAEVFPRDESGKIHFTEIVEVENASSASLYLKAKQFMTSYWNSAKDVTQMDDKEAGILITSGFAEVPYLSLIHI